MTGPTGPGVTGPTGPGTTGPAGGTGPTGPCCTGPTGPSANGSNNFVFRPGDPAPADNVYTDWPTLAAALPTVQGYKTIQFCPGYISPSPLVIPPGIWDMKDTEWFGFTKTDPPLADPSGRIVVEIADGATFLNLHAMGGELLINNLNTMVAAIVVPPDGSLLKIGTSAQGVYPVINNLGSAPFVDASGLTGTAVFALCLQGSIVGESPAIQMGAVAGTRLVLNLFDMASISSGMIAASNPAISANLYQTPAASFGRQPTFAGTITAGTPTTGIGLGLTRFFYSPYAGSPPMPTVPSQVDITPAAGLGMNAVLRLDTTFSNVTQTLPLIRADAPPINASPNDPGIIDSTGLVVIVKNEVGGNVVEVRPDTSEAPPDTLEGTPGPYNVPQGAALIFMSDGVSNWIVVGAFAPIP